VNNGGNDCRRISRRVALAGAALALGAAAIATAVSQAAAQQPSGRVGADPSAVASTAKAEGVTRHLVDS